MRHRTPEKQTKQDEEKEPIIQFSEKKANTFKDFFSSFAKKKTIYRTINQSQNENIVDFLIFRLYRSDIIIILKNNVNLNIYSYFNTFYIF